MLLTLLVGALGAVAAGLLAGLLYIAAGGFNVAASIPHDPATYWATKTMMVRSVKLQARKVEPPAGFTRAQVLAGFRTYEGRCVACHGAPNLAARAPWADGMTPPPPYLVDAARDWSRAELFWIIKYGVKMTGMPAWDRDCSDGEIWELVAFLEALPRMDSTGYRDLRAAQAGSPAAAPSGCARAG